MLLPESINYRLIALLLVCSFAPAPGADLDSANQQKINEAIKDLRQYAEAGNPTAQFHLAQEYFHGRYLPRNNQLGIMWATRAAEGGESGAQIGMGVLYHFGENIVEPDYKKAMYWYRKAAEGYESLAYTYIGILYHEGLGVQRNDTLAMQWITRGAENGDALGQAVLGGMYLEGDGATQDYEKANHWLTESAHNGSSLGKYNLGKSFELGLGVTKDQKKALYWYKKAADQGHLAARQHLEKIGHTTTASASEQDVPHKQSSVEIPAQEITAKRLPKKPKTSAPPIIKKHHKHAATPTQADPLQNIPVGSYALQLLAVKELENAIKFNNRHRINGQIWQYQVADNTWYLLIEGIYQDRQSGNHASKRLTQLQQEVKPWLRSLDALRKKGVTVRILPVDQL